MYVISEEMCVFEVHPISERVGRTDSDCGWSVRGVQVPDPGSLGGVRVASVREKRNRVVQSQTKTRTKRSRTRHQVKVRQRSSLL